MVLDKPFPPGVRGGIVVATGLLPLGMRGCGTVGMIMPLPLGVNGSIVVRMGVGAGSLLMGR